QEIWNVMFFPVIGLIVMFFLRGDTVPGTSFSLGTQAVPGILGVAVIFNGLVALGFLLIVDREDGTLLRAKAIPHGMLGYLVGKVTGRAATATVGVLVPLAVSAILFDGIEVHVLTLVWVLVLGLVAVLPI